MLALSKKIGAAAQTPSWFKGSFHQQTDFIKDPALLKAAQCTRRAGKSYGMGIYLCKEAWENPGVSVLYIALTRDSAERILWRDVLKTINRTLDLGATFQETKLTMTFPNGSIIYLLGADAKPDEMDKLLGQKFKLAVIDEASKYRIDLHRLIFDVLKPAMADYRGQIALIGTADNFVNSMFAQITRGKVPGWSVHKWSAMDNPHMKRQFTEEIEEFKSKDPDVVNQAWFIQNYMGQWVVDTRALVYQYDPKDLVSTVPELSTYCLGIVLSYSGQSAFAVIGTSPKHREAYIVEAYKKPETDLYLVIETAIRLQHAYNFSSIVCVDASDRLADEIRRRFPISVETVNEKDKSALIQIFNAELSKNHVKVLKSNTDIINEWSSIIKDDKASRGTIREHPACPNQAASAALYAWSKCFNYGFSESQLSDDPIDAYWDELAEDINQDQGRPFHDF